ncbi:MAG: DUF2855 family protein [Saprospiraceae bacterium]|nr:DUF2855 family protein [bacterium]MDC3219560.1 DUF2855 family protein [Saprospiraceae bacterium]MDG1434184.1 DUF2855 family protein [Saprospiraceae bacterium]MDG2419054.1 DUF2855 family protein [Saprospiraceae bacterium]
MSNKNKNFLVHKTELNNTKLSDSEISELQNGEVLFRIDKYAMTTNNITYAVVGHKIGYWQFFPAEEPYGIVPVWGYADVVESKHDGVKVGERFYGYFPMGNFLKIEVGKCSPFGITDGSTHRAELAPIYNSYSNIKADVSYNQEMEDYAPIVRPLFTTSFLNYQFLKSEIFFDAEQIIITSASSKTSMGLAFMLKKNQEDDGKRIVGLTSPGNLEFVKNTGYYDEVIAYNDLEKDLNQKDSIVVDMAGNSKLLFRIYDFLNEKLKFSSLIGLTDWTSEKEFKTLPRSKFFFAPAFAQQLFKEWGIEKANKEIAMAGESFTRDASQWMDLVYFNDFKSLSKLYHEMLQGKVDPRKGNIVKI